MERSQGLSVECRTPESKSPNIWLKLFNMLYEKGLIRETQEALLA